MSIIYGTRTIEEVIFYDKHENTPVYVLKVKEGNTIIDYIETSDKAKYDALKVSYKMKGYKVI